jgi:hypothetical protein
MSLSSLARLGVRCAGDMFRGLYPCHESSNNGLGLTAPSVASFGMAIVLRSVAVAHPYRCASRLR